MMTPRPRLRSIITLLLMLLFFIVNGTGETHANTKDEWWDHHWIYRIPLDITETGPVSNTLNFSQILNDFGLLNAIIDLRSLQVVPYINGIPGEPVPFEETFSHLIIDADQISIGTPPNDMYWAFSEESTSIDIDEVRKTQGVGSLHAYVEISEYSNLNTGFYFFFNDSLLGNWSNYEVLIYDIYPDVHEVGPLDLETLFLFKLDGLMNCRITYIDGPQLTNAAWNGIDLLLQSFGECQYPDYSALNKIRFIFEKDSNSYLENGDNLDIWVDNFRLFDQDADGQVIWNVEENIDCYYLYFNLLKDAEIPTYLPIVFR